MQPDGPEKTSTEELKLTDKFGPKGNRPGALAVAVEPHAQGNRLAS